MKQVAGSLKLELAQYRELQAFAQFGSDLDPATQKTLTRGEKLVEILKQGQYSPVPVEEQVMMIHAGTSGALDQVPTARVQDFEKSFLEYMRDAKPEVGQAILETGKLSDEGKAAIEAGAQTVRQQMGA
jgi:F-type H+-transporting ATPase subunit alpha